MTIKQMGFLLILIFSMGFSKAFAAPVDAQALYLYLQKNGVEHVETFHSSEVAEKEYNWKLLVYSYRYKQSLAVFNQATGQLIYTYSHESMMDNFVRLQWVELDGYESPLIASVWRRGVHGEQLILLDPLDKKILYRLTSSWPLSFQASEQGIAITITGDDDHEGIPIEETHYWPAASAININKEKGE